MSWLTKLNNVKLTIKTGDGQIYTPLWRNAIKNISYNTEAFEFIGVNGTYIERNEQKGNQFPILFYFQGEGCVDIANAFEISARDKRAWTITHPYYDELLVQPIELTIDNSEHNVSKITGTVWETIEQKYPDDELNAAKEIDVRKNETDLEAQAVFVDEIGIPDPIFTEPAVESIEKTGSNYSILAQTETDIALLKDKIRSASSAAQEVISNTTRYISQANDLINFPFLIEQNITQKVDSFINTFNNFATIFLDDATEEKLIAYEIQGYMLLSSLSQNLINTSEDDYETRSEVVNVYNSLNDSYAAYLKNLDDLGYLQDKTISSQFDYIVNFTLSRLSEIAFDSKQERSYILEKDNNIVVLAHRFYGRGDDNLDLFVKQNNISLNEYLGLRKGRIITYFV